VKECGMGLKGRGYSLDVNTGCVCVALCVCVCVCARCNGFEDVQRIMRLCYMCPVCVCWCILRKGGSLGRPAVANSSPSLMTALGQWGDFIMHGKVPAPLKHCTDPRPVSQSQFHIFSEIFITFALPSWACYIYKISCI